MCRLLSMPTQAAAQHTNKGTKFDGSIIHDYSVLQVLYAMRVIQMQSSVRYGHAFRIL